MKHGSMEPVVVHRLGQVGQCPTKNFQEKQFFLHKAIYSYSKIQQETVGFSFLSLTLNLPCGFHMKGGR